MSGILLFYLKTLKLKVKNKIKKTLKTLLVYTATWWWPHALPEELVCNQKKNTWILNIAAINRNLNNLSRKQINDFDWFLPNVDQPKDAVTTTRRTAKLTPPVPPRRTIRQTIMATVRGRIQYPNTQRLWKNDL